jgi:hypothetical protein
MLTNSPLYGNLMFRRRGRVAEGVISILGELPIVRVEVRDLPALVGDPSMSVLVLRHFRRSYHIFHCVDTDLRKVVCFQSHGMPQHSLMGQNRYI